MATQLEKWQEIANRGLQDRFDPETRKLFDAAVTAGVITIPGEESQRRVPPIQKIAGALEAAGTIAIGAIGEAAGGVAGIPVQALELAGIAPQGAAEYVSERVAGDLTVAPTTKTGREYLQNVGEFFQSNVAPYTSDPLEAASVAAGQYVQDQQGSGIIDASASPAEATLVHMVPQVAATLAGGAVPRIVGRGLAAASQRSMPLIERLPEVPRITQSAKDRAEIARMIEAGSDSSKTVPYQLQPPPQTAAGAIARKAGIGRTDVVKNPVEVEAVRQSIPADIIPAIRNANPATKDRLARMLDSMAAGRESRRAFIEQRPIDIAGQSLNERISVIRDANEKAASQLDRVASDLKGKYVDVDAPVREFRDDLASIRVNLSEDGKLDLSKSLISGLSGPESLIKRIVEFMRGDKRATAEDAHNLKRYIDANVSYGKQVEGLDGNVERIIKKFRNAIDSTLDNEFPEYNRINTAYSETIGAMNAVQDFVGSKVDLLADGSDRALALALRSIDSNSIRRATQVPETLKLIDDVAERYYRFSGTAPDGRLLLDGPRPGKRFQDDLFTQVMYAGALDEIFTPAAKGSFENLSGRQAVRAMQQMATGAVDPGFAADMAGEAMKRMRGVSEEGQMRAMRDLLKTQGD